MNIQSFRHHAHHSSPQSTTTTTTITDRRSLDDRRSRLSPTLATLTTLMSHPPLRRFLHRRPRMDLPTTVPGGHKCIEFGSIRTGGASIMVHALLQFGLCIKDCDQTVERGRELRSDHKMVARALTRKGTTLVKLAKMVQWRIWVWFMDCNLGLFCIFRQDEDEARSLR
ncbi:uncharacterized protein LOC141633742 isoform X1 [Silene latifolia]|uniref:uncharacterized protein LOC141633742 isoform X1 n=1 Tax=Silene latifolia TaxID=37657 RepID=UPI003D76D6B8